MKQRHDPSTVVEAPPPVTQEDGESELRVAPVGADSAEEVFESNRQTSEADVTQTGVTPEGTAPEETAPAVHTDVAVMIENEADVVAQNTEINSRSSYHEQLTHVVNANGTNASRETEQNEGSESVNQDGQSSSGSRMDAVALPNTELSTLC